MVGASRLTSVVNECYVVNSRGQSVSVLYRLCRRQKRHSLLDFSIGFLTYCPTVYGPLIKNTYRIKYLYLPVVGPVPEISSPDTRLGFNRAIIYASERQLIQEVLTGRNRIGPFTTTIVKGHTTRSGCWKIKTMVDSSRLTHVVNIRGPYLCCIIAQILEMAQFYRFQHRVSDLLSDEVRTVNIKYLLYNVLVDKQVKYQAIYQKIISSFILVTVMTSPK